MFCNCTNSIVFFPTGHFMLMPEVFSGDMNTSLGAFLHNSCTTPSLKYVDGQNLIRKTFTRFDTLNDPALKACRYKPGHCFQTRDECRLQSLASRLGLELCRPIQYFGVAFTLVPVFNNCTVKGNPGRGPLMRKKRQPSQYTEKGGFASLDDCYARREDRPV